MNRALTALRRLSIALVLAGLAALLHVPLQYEATASPVAAAAPTAAPRPDDPTTARDTPARLQQGWRRSDDAVVTTIGDSVGLHVLLATARSGYTWTTAATLGGPLESGESWVGNACVTSSGRYAVVVYAPRDFVNDEALYLRGAAAAVVDLRNGKVRTLDAHGTLAYFNPGCGSGDDAVLTQLRFAEEHHGATATRLVRVDARTATEAAPALVHAQLSSAVPVRDTLVAVRGDRIVAVAPSGRTRTVVRHAGGAFGLTVDGAGRVAYLSGTRDRNAVRRVDPADRLARPTTLASSHDGWLGLQRGTGGRVLVLDPDASQQGATSGAGVSTLRAQPDDLVSTEGQVVLSVPTTRPEDGSRGAPPAVRYDDDGRATAHWTATVTATGAEVEFDVPTGINVVGRSTADGTNGASRTATDVSGPQSPDATCSVPRNDPKTLVYQPTPHQVEWAVDLAVKGKLLTARPANWKGSGLPSWTPQKMFPLPALHGGGTVPPQVMLGILAQESNLWQATGHALSGVYGNPLIGDYYGRNGGWTTNFKDADCGYGVGQVTDNMRKGAMDATKQRAIALDYATNIAAALQILISKWNQAYDAGVIHDNGDPADIENWFFAVWAYNTGFYPNKGDGSPWGVGWFNNPANPVYKPDRTFFNANPADPVHPERWPYPEKIMGWAAYPIYTLDGPGFAQAWWTTGIERDLAKPPVYHFCDASNACSANTNGCPAVNSTCWWHKPTSYHKCSDNVCGVSDFEYGESSGEPADGTNYPPKCELEGLPAGSLLVDDVGPAVETERCGRSWTQAGSFALDFESAAGRIDFHQTGSGFGGHFWFAHTRSTGFDTSQRRATGTWTFDRSLDQWGRVFVHLPDHGAHTQQAAYEIQLGDGTSETRYALQRRGGNGWVSLGVFRFRGNPRISLSSTTWDGNGTEDVAYDAAAIQPLSAKPRDFVVALGDSYISGEGATTYDFETNYGGKYGEDDRRRNACHRSAHAWPRKIVLAGTTTELGTREEELDPTLDFQFAACSGAESENLLPYHLPDSGSPTNADGDHGTGMYNEVSQIDKGYLDANTTLVLLSIGGNDAQFGPVIGDCASPLDIGADCRSANTTGQGPNDEVIPDLIRTKVRESVTTVIRQVHRYAPNAKILLMGYPQLISDGANCLAAVGLNENEALWIDDMSTVMDTMLSEVVSSFDNTGTDVTLGNPVSDFWGQGVCGDPERIHGLVLDKTDGDPDGAPYATESFHPTFEGTTLYAKAATRALRDMGF